MKKILLIDDQASFCFFVKKNLETLGEFKVSVCCEGARAVSHARQLQPDLILLDVFLPGISGPEIAEQLKSAKETCHIPIVFLTAVATEQETEEKGNLIGGQYVVAKPVQTDRLLQVIDAATR